MPFTRAQLVEMFTYHAPSDAQIEHYQAVRTAALEFASVISEHVPPSPDQSVAIRKVREAVHPALTALHSANAAIALAGKY